MRLLGCRCSPWTDLEHHLSSVGSRWALWFPSNRQDWPSKPKGPVNDSSSPSKAPWTLHGGLSPGSDVGSGGRRSTLAGRELTYPSVQDGSEEGPQEAASPALRLPLRSYQSEAWSFSHPLSRLQAQRCCSTGPTPLELNKRIIESCPKA